MKRQPAVQIKTESLVLNKWYLVTWYSDGTARVVDLGLRDPQRAWMTKMHRDYARRRR